MWWRISVSFKQSLTFFFKIFKIILFLPSCNICLNLLRCPVSSTACNLTEFLLHLTLSYSWQLTHLSSPTDCISLHSRIIAHWSPWPSIPHAVFLMLDSRQTFTHPSLKHADYVLFSPGHLWNPLWFLSLLLWKRKSMSYVHSGRYQR